MQHLELLNTQRLPSKPKVDTYLLPERSARICVKLHKDDVAKSLEKVAKDLVGEVKGRASKDVREQE